ncbi:MAG: DUF2062 domain-containing protein [Alphaproteobacteria bacterium]|nr:DUF2062 domain-containing protein [Alphaproteobacteria bacterium]
MFKRRNKKTILSKIKNSLWPDGGWKRYGQYLLLRLSRLKGTPSSLAAGLACGVAISFTPFVGFHFVLAALTAFLFRGNILASALGTAAGNPWTFPFIWMSVFYTGRKFLGVSADMSQHVDFLKFFEKSMRALMTFDFSLFFADIWPILWPMMIGCIPFYLVSWFLTYYLVKGMLIRLNTKSFLKKEEKL